MLKDTKELPMIKYGVWFSANDYKEDTISIQNYYALDISEKNLMRPSETALPQGKAEPAITKLLSHGID